MREVLGTLFALAQEVLIFTALLGAVTTVAAGVGYLLDVVDLYVVEWAGGITVITIVTVIVLSKIMDRHKLDPFSN